MSVSSAEPAKLQAFIDNTGAARTSAADARQAAAYQQSTVKAASPDYGVDVDIVYSLYSRLSSLADNDTFVSTIRTELLAADQHNGGPITVTDVALQAALDAAGAGTPPPRLQFEPTTMYGLPPTSGFVDDPICAANGNMVHHDRDLDFPGIAGALDLGRTYNSLLGDVRGAFGPGWSSLFDMRLTAGSARVEIRLADGATVAFVRHAQRWEAFGRRVRALVRTDDGWEVQVDDLRTFRFDAAGRLTGWSLGSAQVTVERAGDLIRRVTEARSGRWYELDWTMGDNSLVERVTASDGKTIRYERDAEGRLRRAVSAAGHLDYEWDGALLRAVVDADGVRPFVNDYDADGRVIRQTSPFGRVTDYRYEDDGLTVITDQRGVRQAMVHDGRGNLTAVIDVDGSAMRLTYDHLDRVVLIVDRGGAERRFRYDDRDRLVERVDPDGLCERWSWDELGRVTSRTERAGGVTELEYRGALRAPVRIVGPQGEVTTAEIDEMLDVPRRIVDPDGIVTVVDYDADAQPVMAIDGEGGRTTFDYDAAGRLASYHDAVGTATTLDYDDGGRLIRQRRGAAVTYYSRTAAGRVAGGSEPGDAAWSATFGPHGAPTAISDATGSSVRLGYDTMGNVTSIVAPDGAIYRQEFDQTGRLVAIVDPEGGVTRQRYDRSGHLVEVADPSGRRARRELDVFGRTRRSIAADGTVTAFGYHPNGEIASITGPDGRTWRSDIDLHGRVIGVTTPSGGRSELTYTPGGRLSSRRSPAGRIERFEYDAAGRRSAIVDAAGVRHEFSRDERGRMTAVNDGGDRGRLDVTWDALGRVAGYSTPRSATRFEHDEAGRTVARVDGDGARTEYEWDRRGLLVGATDPSGARSSFAYDDRGRLTAQHTPGGRTSSWRYDGVGRLAGMTDPSGVSTDLERDAAGFVTRVARGDAGWEVDNDDAGRAVRRRSPDGTVLGEYDYDASGRMTRASTPAGWSTQFLWDDDDRVTGIVDSAGTTLIERDADGWATALTRADGTRTLIERNPMGRIVAVRDDEAGELHAAQLDAGFDVAGRLMLAPDGTVYRYDDAGRLAEIVPADGSAPAEYRYGDDGLLAWVGRGATVRSFTHDSAGRVSSITTEDGRSTTIGYDSAGRRTSEVSSDGTRFEYRWEGLDRLVEIRRTPPGGQPVSVRITHDALGLPRSIGGQSIEYDPLNGLPSQVGDVRLVNAAGMTWRSDHRHWVRARAGVAQGLTLGSLTFLGARVLDQSSQQFLSPDPLLTVPGSNGASSAYTFAWNDPINFADPSGMRPISQEEWNALREREEQGRVGQAWQAIKDDPWGTLAAGVVIVAGAVMLATPLAPIGAGILIGAAVSAGTGFATGTFSPRQVALGGVLGGITGGAGAAGLSAGGQVLLGVGVGAGGDLASQMLDGGPIDWTSVAVNGAVGGLTGGIGARAEPWVTSGGRAATVGAVSDGASSVVTQALTGDHTVDLTEVAVSAAGGAASGYADHHFGAGDTSIDSPPATPQPLALPPGAPAPLALPAGGPEPLALPPGPTRLALPPGPSSEMVTVYRQTDTTVELQIHHETGLIMSDAAREGYMGSGGSLDQAQAASAAAHQQGIETWGSEGDYVEAHGAFGHDITDVSGPRSMVSVTTDPAAAAHFGGKDAVLFEAQVPRDSLIPQTLPGAGESELLAPHSIQMTPVGSGPQ